MQYVYMCLSVSLVAWSICLSCMYAAVCVGINLTKPCLFGSACFDATYFFTCLRRCISLKKKTQQQQQQRHYVYLIYTLFSSLVTLLIPPPFITYYYEYDIFLPYFSLVFLCNKTDCVLSVCFDWRINLDPNCLTLLYFTLFIVSINFTNG